MKKTVKKSHYSFLAIFIVAFLTMAIAVSAVAATDYYVSPTGNDANDGSNTSLSKQSISDVTTTASSGDTIYLSDGVYKGLKNKGITIDKSLTFVGESKKNTIIDAEKNGRIFKILPDFTVSFVNITFKNGLADDGGAIYNQGGYLTINNCIFEKNTANYRGGAVFNEWTYGVKVENSLFEGNTAGGSGGAVYYFYGNHFSIEQSQFTKNYAANSGGAVFNDHGDDLTLCTCEFAENTANNCGGALYTFYADRIIVSNSVFKLNKAIITSGGAIFNEHGNDFTVANCKFEENFAEIYGGAVDTFWGDRVTFFNNIFIENTAGFGGAIFNEHGNDITIEKCEFTKNKAFYGGAFYNFHGIGANIILPTVSGNIAMWSAGEFLFNEWSRDVTIIFPDLYRLIYIDIYTTIPDEITVGYLLV
ncbi:MAG: hypothetical protein FWH54_00890 [Methanobrevibacter sp.]|nr:hypothetical protein [Methanobrevibacter sp.]